MFHDRARFMVRAGRGGDGALSFRREKHVPKGGPDGGDGGRGGDVVLTADADLRDLSAFRSRRVIRAGRGAHGRGAGKHGAVGEHVVLGVPVGTQVLDEQGQVLADLAHPLRLKLLADAALVGLPNAGKSSLLRRISNARPKVADYPFTTLEPVLGTVEAPDGRQLVVADVPGLIEGAAQGAGLGHEFLAHLERARMLIHVIDSAAGDRGEQFRAIDGELVEYGAGLERLPQAVVLNKIDLLPLPPTLPVEDERIVAVFPVSCATGKGVEELKRALFALVAPPPEPEVPEPEMADYLVYRPKPSRAPFRLLRTERGYRVLGSPPSLEALEQALRAAGVKQGDEVVVGDEELEYS